MNAIKSAIVIMAILVISSFMIFCNEIKAESKSGYIQHEPIYINGNENFTAENGVKSGNGSKENPYLIEGWDINASKKNGIEIRNTTNYFLIKNCYVYSGRYGIYFENVRNGTIADTNICNTLYGIYLMKSFNCEITNNSVYNDLSIGYIWYSGGCGIYLEDSSENRIINNNATNNLEDSMGYGIVLSSSSNTTMKNNIINNYQYNFGIKGENISYYHHDIDSTNKINGDQIYYLQNQSNLIFDGKSKKIGYIGLISCDNITVKNYNLTKNQEGILLVNTRNSLIEYNNIFNNERGGILFYSSSDNKIFNNAIYKNDGGIYFTLYSSNNIIENNTVYSNKYNGVVIAYSSNNEIINNRIYSNQNHGIYFTSSNNNQIIENEISNHVDGLSFSNSSNNKIINNTISDHYYGISFYSDSNYNSIYMNDFKNTNNGFDNGVNYWNSTEKGNYWSDYSGKDENNDGIGDTPYSISGGNNKDNFPLMKPVNNFTVPQNQKPQENQPQKSFIPSISIIPILISLSIIAIFQRKLKKS